MQCRVDSPTAPLHQSLRCRVSSARRGAGLPPQLLCTLCGNLARTATGAAHHCSSEHTARTIHWRTVSSLYSDKSRTILGCVPCRCAHRHHVRVDTASLTRSGLSWNADGRASRVVEQDVPESLSMVRHWSTGMSSWQAAKVVNSCEPEKSSTSQICRADKGIVGQWAGLSQSPEILTATELEELRAAPLGFAQQGGACPAVQWRAVHNSGGPAAAFVLSAAPAAAPMQ